MEQNSLESFESAVARLGVRLRLVAGIRDRRLLLADVAHDGTGLHRYVWARALNASGAGAKSRSSELGERARV